MSSQTKVYLTSMESVAANREILEQVITAQAIPTEIIQQLGGGLVVLSTTYLGNKLFSATRHEDSYGVYVSISGCVENGVAVRPTKDPSTGKANYNFKLAGWCNLYTEAREGEARMVLDSKQVEALEAWLEAPKGEKPNLFFDFSQAEHFVFLPVLSQEQRYVRDASGKPIQVTVEADGRPVYQLEPYWALSFSAAHTVAPLSGDGTGGKGISSDALAAAMARFHGVTSK